jgi:hypothetical protein
MTNVRKIVRFFDTVATDEENVRGPVQDNFWTDLIDAMGGWSYQEREFPVAGVKYFGIGQRPSAPGLPHVQVGRVRDLSEQLERYNLSDGSVQPLEFDDPDDRVAEPTYIVPFGLRGRVAIMSPAVRATRAETLGRWLTGVCELVPLGRSIDLVPVVDPEIVAKIINASGAVMLQVHVDAGAEVPDAGGGSLGDAFRDAKHQSLEEMDLTVRWSLGRSNGSESAREAIQNAALWVAQGGFSSKAEVRIVSEDDDGQIKRDLHQIFDDRIAKSVEFFVPEGERASDEVILDAIANAIRQFRDDA